MPSKTGVAAIAFLALLVATVIAVAYLAPRGPPPCAIHVRMQQDGAAFRVATVDGGPWPLEDLSYQFSDPTLATGTLAHPGAGARWQDSVGNGTADAGDALVVDRAQAPTQLTLRDVRGTIVGGTSGCS